MQSTHLKQPNGTHFRQKKGLINMSIEFGHGHVIQSIVIWFRICGDRLIRVFGTSSLAVQEEKKKRITIGVNYNKCIISCIRMKKKNKAYNYWKSIRIYQSCLKRKFFSISHD